MPHTPGTWTIESMTEREIGDWFSIEAEVLPGRFGAVVDTANNDYRLDSETIYANALLVASAPDLLEYAQKVVGLLHPCEACPGCLYCEGLALIKKATKGE